MEASVLFLFQSGYVSNELVHGSKGLKFRPCPLNFNEERTLQRFLMLSRSKRKDFRNEKKTFLLPPFCHKNAANFQMNWET